MIRTFDQIPLLTPDSDWRAPDEMPRIRGCYGRIAIDTETYDPQLRALGPGTRRGARIIGLALGAEGAHRRWYFPIGHREGGNMDEKLFWRWARRELNDFEGEVVGANLIYDLDMLAEAGITFPRVKRFLDVQIAEPLIDENQLEFNLEYLAQKYLGEGKDEALMRDAATAYGCKPGEVKPNLWRLHAKYVGAYAEADADLPLRIMRKQEVIIAAQKLEQVFDIETRLIPILLAMRRRGVRVDSDAADGVKRRLRAERDLAMAEVRRWAGPAAELMAPDSLAPALKARGLPLTYTAKTKKPSITQPWLKAHSSDPLVAAILAGRKVDYIINTFINGHIFGHAVNGRIHCEFNQLKRDDSEGGGGTIARFSSSNPNLQNIPKRDKVIGPLVRGLFLPEEGETWTRHDYSQIEYRLLVHYAIGRGADRARQLYCDNPKTDYHKMCAGFAKVDPEDEYQRSFIKTVNFCKVYGGGAAKIASILGIDVAEAQDFIDLYDKELPFVNATNKAAQDKAEKRGYVFTILGRRQRFHLWEPPRFLLRRDPELFDLHSKYGPKPRAQAEQLYGMRLVLWQTYAALNRVLQAGAADLMKRAMVLIWESGLCDVIGPPLVTVHDELGNSINPELAAHMEAINELQHILHTALQFKVPILAERQMGLTWGSCEK